MFIFFLIALILKALNSSPKVKIVSGNLLCQLRSIALKYIKKAGGFVSERTVNGLEIFTSF